MEEKTPFTTKWNWGAFINPIGFAIGNRAYLGLLTLIPIFNIVWIFITGAKAEQWALSNPANDYRDEEEFRKIMDSWKRYGFVMFIVVLVLIVLYLIFALTIGVALWNTNVNY